jgi:hypothetical protein
MCGLSWNRPWFWPELHQEELILFITGHHSLAHHKMNIKNITSQLNLPFLVEVQHFLPMKERVCVDCRETYHGFGHNFIKNSSF